MYSHVQEVNSSCTALHQPKSNVGATRSMCKGSTSANNSNFKNGLQTIAGKHLHVLWTTGKYIAALLICIISLGSCTKKPFDGPPSKMTFQTYQWIEQQRLNKQDTLSEKSDKTMWY